MPADGWISGVGWNICFLVPEVTDDGVRSSGNIVGSTIEIDLQHKESLVLHGKGHLRDTIHGWVDRLFVLAALCTDDCLAVNRILSVVIEENLDHTLAECSDNSAGRGHVA